jgi:hypothetical protein
MKTKTCLISWERQSKMLRKHKTYNKSTLNLTGKPTVTWSTFKVSMNVWHGTTTRWNNLAWNNKKYYNSFGANLLRIQGTTCSCQHRVWEIKTSSNCSYPRLESLVGNGLNTIEQIEPHHY